MGTTCRQLVCDLEGKEILFIRNGVYEYLFRIGLALFFLQMVRSGPLLDI